MLKSLLAFLTALVEVIRLLIIRRTNPTQRQIEDEINHEIRNIQKDVEKSRLCGDDAGADAMLRRVRQRLSVESDSSDDTARQRRFDDPSARQ